MSLARWIITACWLTFAVYWLIAAVGVKRTVGGSPWRRQVVVRLALIALLVLLLRFSALRHDLVRAQVFESRIAALSAAGAALCVLGMALAIWARIHLGRNWGMPMSQKEHPELIVTGPYAFCRHPIYGGMLLAMLGSALAGNVFWALLLVAFGVYFIISARREERLLCRQFPDSYPAYMQRTRMLLPFLF